MLIFNVTNQIIERVDNFPVVADSKKYLKATFVLSEEWGSDTKVVFGHEGNYYQVTLDEDLSCEVPFEVIKTPFFTVSVYCENDTVITSSVCVVGVEASGFVEGEIPGTPTPTVWSQYLEQMRQIINSGLPYVGSNNNWFVYNANTLQYADTGVCARGTSPTRGVDYWTDEDKNEIKKDVGVFFVDIITCEDGSCTASKSYDEIIGAHGQGRVVQGYVDEKNIIGCMSEIGSERIVWEFMEDEVQTTVYCTQSNVWSYVVKKNPSSNLQVRVNVEMSESNQWLITNPSASYNEIKSALDEGRGVELMTCLNENESVIVYPNVCLLDVIIFTGIISDEIYTVSVTLNNEWSWHVKQVSQTYIGNIVCEVSHNQEGEEELILHKANLSMTDIMQWIEKGFRSIYVEMSMKTEGGQVENTAVVFSIEGYKPSSWITFSGYFRNTKYSLKGSQTTQGETWSISVVHLASEEWVNETFLGGVW